MEEIMDRKIKNNRSVKGNFEIGHEQEFNGCRISKLTSAAPGIQAKVSGQLLLLQWLSGQAYLPAMPISISIEPTTSCTCAALSALRASILYLAYGMHCAPAPASRRTGANLPYLIFYFQEPLPAPGTAGNGWACIPKDIYRHLHQCPLP